MRLSDLRQFDPRARESGRNRRYCCPECGGDRPRDIAHRSLVVDFESGLYLCHRCDTRGRLEEYRDQNQREPIARRISRAGRSRATAHRFASVNLSPETPRDLDRERLDLYQAASLDQVGADYLLSRGLDPELARASGVKSSPSWYGRPAVLFPLRDASGDVVAVQGRYIDGRAPKCRSTTGTGGAVFRAGDPAGVVAIAEGPVDALALCEAGLPAIAIIGARPPGWMTRSLRGSILIATDADEAGDRAASEISQSLRVDPSRVARLRPHTGKDFAEAYQLDPVAIRYRIRGFSLRPLDAIDAPPDIPGVEPLTDDDIRIMATRDFIASGDLDLARIAVSLIADREYRTGYRYRILQRRPNNHDQNNEDTIG